MGTTKLSSKGQVIIPKVVRNNHKWDTGLELMVIDTGDGILLRPKAPFPGTSLGDVAGMLKDRIQPKTDREIQSAVARAFKDKWRDRD